MCEEADYYYTSMTHSCPTAKKEHSCSACRNTIKIGQVYQKTICITDGFDIPFEEYKHCLRCWAILQAIMKARPDDAIDWTLNCGENWLDTIGDLPLEVAALAFINEQEAQEYLMEETVKDARRRRKPRAPGKRAV